MFQFCYFTPAVFNSAKRVENSSKHPKIHENMYACAQYLNHLAASNSLAIKLAICNRAGAHIAPGRSLKEEKRSDYDFSSTPLHPPTFPFFFLNMQFKSLTPPLAALGLETVRVISSGCKLRPALALREKTTQEGRILDPERPHTKHGQQSILFRFFVYLWCP